MLNLIISPEAEEDLLPIWLYIAEDQPKMQTGFWPDWRPRRKNWQNPRR